MLTPSALGFVLSLVIAALLVFVFDGALKMHPSVFYLIAAAATALYVCSRLPGAAFSLPAPLGIVFQKGYLASILLAVVMFCGCFDEGTPARRKLQPVRGELSILSFIMIVGHIATYLPSYLPRLGVLLSARSNVAASLGVAIVLTVLFAVLAAMSPRAVRLAMNKRVWKAVQRLAYVMVALLAVHVGLVLGRAVFVQGSTTAVATFAAYVGAAAVYAALRIRKAVRDRAKKSVVAAEAQA